MYDIWDNDFDRKFDEAVDAMEKKEHRLIWADELKRHYAWWGDNDQMKRIFDNIVEQIKTVDAVPIKHGRWEYTDYGGVGNWHCSVCHNIVVGAKGASLRTPYCPNCGAKMDEVEDG